MYREMGKGYFIVAYDKRESTIPALKSRKNLFYVTAINFSDPITSPPMREFRVTFEKRDTRTGASAHHRPR